jgi:hypothetical protein
MAQAFGVVFKGCPSPLPTVSQGEGKDTPFIQVLDARVGKGESAVGGEALDVYITAVFKKYTVSHSFPLVRPQSELFQSVV